ncbi:hypothetical protein SAMN05216480_101298 [Pustulibacterium marinum]|uniref:Uncharacterized protein n=1 Tax=Pustulibacterium marinum TaxID=1224947 RepID=A0A1I7EVI5_9FLAO|nr:hypothetical protein [Pustulibacterium marinum]SFU27933.1 hypothetical protein SAMN05216480_101298 [Pustulibacterium marinum]
MGIFSLLIYMNICSPNLLNLLQMKVYDVCGAFDPVAKTVQANIMLPKLKHGGTYDLQPDFYNMSVTNSSNRTFYFILGVLKITGETIQDLAEYKTDMIELTTLPNSSISFSAVKNPLNINIDLNSATAQDTLHCLIMHQQDFDLNNGGLDILEIINGNILSYIGGLDYKAMVFPPKGGGGPTKISGCQF